MAQKLEALLDDDTYHRTEQESMRRGKRVSEIVEEALILYFEQRERARPAEGAVARSWGALKLDRQELEQLVREPGVLDT